MLIFLRHNTRLPQLQCWWILEPEGSPHVLMLQTCCQSKYPAEKPPLKGSGPSQGKLSIRHEGGPPIGTPLSLFAKRVQRRQLVEGTAGRGFSCLLWLCLQGTQKSWQFRRWRARGKHKHSDLCHVLPTISAVLPWVFLCLSLQRWARKKQNFCLHLVF